MRLMDAIVLNVMGQVVGYLHFGNALIKEDVVHSMLVYFCTALAFVLFPQLDIYSSWRGRSIRAMLVRIAFAWALALSIGIFGSFLIHHVGALSRMWVVEWYAAGVGCLALSRVAVYRTLRSLRVRGLNHKRVILVGYGVIGREMHRRAEEQDWLGYEICALHADDAEVAESRSPLPPRLACLEDIPAYAAQNRIDEIWITLPMSASAQLAKLQYLLRNTLADIRWMPDTMSMQMLSSKMVDFLGLPAVNINEPLASGVNGLAKELFDRVFALITLILLVPLFVVISILIKLSSPGPVFFRQPRLGLNGKPFMVYKFRSMIIHQENDKVTQATKDDPRITKIGRFLRRTSLDELPQFINVLCGDMSVVGPRPHALQHNEMYKELLDFYMLRHRVKPGITGWAQIHGHRGETDTVDKMAKRVQFDLHYIKNWSLWMDIRIIVWTALRGWTDPNAY